MTDKVHIQQTKRSNASKMENETKSKETGDRKRKIDEIHNDLRYDLAFKHLDGQSSKKFRGAAWKHLNHADRSYTEPFEILDRLESTGNFAPGKYGFVREIGEKIEEKSFVEAINEAERRIAKIDAEDDDQPKPRNDKITNIIDQTKKELEDHLSDSSYVPLHVVDHIKKVLHRKGLVVLVGPSGCGKSKSVLQILSKVKKGRVLKLQSLHDWPEMVQVAFENWVWFDDVFEKNPIDKNRSVMATISACVADKRTKVLFTVVSEVFEQYRFVFDRLLSTDNIINFKEPQYELGLEMKSRILHAHVRANGITIQNGLRPSGNQSQGCDENTKYIYEDDVQEILMKKPMLGFPQSCCIFCRNPLFLHKGHKFFDDPSEELLQAINSMNQSDCEQFVTLLYAFHNGGKIDLNGLNESLISTLFRNTYSSSPLNVEACIRKASKALKGKFLKEKDSNRDILVFPHTSIYRAVALSYSEISNSTKLQVISMLGTTYIVDIVKTINKGIDSHVIYVPKELYSDIAYELIGRIRGDDLSLFNCSVFAEDDFISVFVPRYQIEIGNLKSSHLRFIFRCGMINLAKAILVAWHSTVDDLKDNDYEIFMKESSIYRHPTAIQYLINKRQDSFQKTTSMIKCLECSIQNVEITSILVRNLSITKLDNTQEKAILKVVTRNESLTSFQFFIETARMQSEMLGYVADLAGRRNAHNCINFLLERYSSDMNDIIIDSTRGACKGGHDRLIDWAIEHYPELIKNKAADFLQHVELPSTLEKLHLRYNSVISKLEFSETLNTLCGKGKSLCVKVLLDRCKIFSDPDIQNAMRAAVKKGHLKTVNVIMETYSIPQDMVSELIETVRQSDNMRPHSAYPFTPAHTPASVLSQNMFTPCSYEQTQKRHNKAFCLKRCMSNQYLSTEGNVYSRAYQILRALQDYSISHESKLQRCEELIKAIPEKYVDLLTESALHSLYDDELFSIFLMKHAMIWKTLFSACRPDKNQLKHLLTSTVRHYRCIRQPFLPSLIDFAIQSNENISDLIYLLIETESTFDVEEFNSTLSKLIVSQKETAKMLVQKVEEMTSENSVFLPLTMCCRYNKMDAFKFIWDNISDQKDIFLDLLSKDIVDQDRKALDIMLPDITRQISISEVFFCCFQKHSRKWISKLSSTHQQELLNSTEFIKSELFKENDPASLVLLIQNVNIGGKESNNLLIQACREGWKDVIQAVLKKKKKIAGGILLKSFDSLIRTNHHDLLHCFQASLNECNVTPQQSKMILDIVITNYEASDTIPPILRSMILRPCFAGHVSSNHITILSPLLSNDAVLESFKCILCEDVYDSEVKRKVFETFRERRIDISDTVRELFYDRCSFDNHLKNTDKLIQNLIDTDYIDERQRIEGMKLCVFQDEIKNQGIARMIMRKEKRTLPFDKSDIFIRICKLRGLRSINTVECVLELYRGDIDDCSLEAGINNLLHEPMDVLSSTNIVNTIIDRRVDITSTVSSLFTCIFEQCHSVNIEPSRILTYIMETYTDIIKESVETILSDDKYDHKAKEKAFNEFRNRGIDISGTVLKVFFERCSSDEQPQSILSNTERFIYHLIDTDYIEQNQRIEGMKLCFFQDEIKNQGIARMIMRKDKTILPFDKSDIFIRICKCKNLFDTETVDCVLELYRDQIDDRSLEAGIHDLLQDPTSVLLSTVIANTIIDRRVDIASNVSSLVTCICETDDDVVDNTGELLKYIKERYTYIINEHVIECFNEATIYSVKTAIETCKIYPKHIKLNEYIILLFLVDDTYSSADRILLINQLSDILNVDKTMCMKFAKETLPLAERWRELHGLFGDSITEDMTWKLVCLCCKHYYDLNALEVQIKLRIVDCLKNILTHSDIKLTQEQIAYLKIKYPSCYDLCLPNEWFDTC